MNIYLFDTIETHQNLLPLSFTRPLADFRCGIFTIIEKWELYLPGDYHFLPVDYLQDQYGSEIKPNEVALFIAGNLLPSDKLADEIKKLEPGEVIFDGDSEDKKNLIAFKGTGDQFRDKDFSKVEKPFYSYKNEALIYIFDIFLKNPDQIKADFVKVTKGRKSAPLPDCVRALSCKKDADISKDIFIEEGAVVECATINTSEGPVYIGKKASLMEGACIRGPFALCEESEVRMGAKIYEGTTIGPHCKVGGEINNTVFFGYSNKAHDGYLGNAVIGEWCNIGAGANASNLKNDYSLIRVWNYKSKSFMRTALQFCGLIMGDHSKIGVNCMINTATVMGVGVNLHGCGFPRQYVPCFCEGSPTSGFSKVPLNKFIDTVERVMSRRDLSPSNDYISLLKYLYDNQ